MYIICFANVCRGSGAFPSLLRFYMSVSAIVNAGLVEHYQDNGSITAVCDGAGRGDGLAGLRVRFQPLQHGF